MDCKYAKRQTMGTASLLKSGPRNLATSLWSSFPRLKGRFHGCHLSMGVVSDKLETFLIYHRWGRMKGEQVWRWKFNSASEIERDKLIFQIDAATWLDLEIIIITEGRQKKTNIIWYQLYVESKKWTYLQNRNRCTDIGNKLMVTEGEGGEG